MVGTGIMMMKLEGIRFLARFTRKRLLVVVSFAACLLALSCQVGANQAAGKHYEEVCGRYQPEVFSNTSTVAGRSMLECAMACSSDRCCAAFMFMGTSCSLSEHTDQTCSTMALPQGSEFYQAKIKCPTNWLPFENSCYYFKADVALNRADSKTVCEALGAHLVSVQSQREMDFLGTSAAGAMGVSKPTSAGKWWTGGWRDPASDMYLNENWLWDGEDGVCNDESMVNYHPWHYGEPNNSPEHQYFLTIKYNNGIWGLSDLAGGKKRRAICEYEG